MVKGMFGTIVQGYLKKGYNRATAEMIAREFLGMRVENKIQEKMQENIDNTQENSIITRRRWQK